MYQFPNGSLRYGALVAALFGGFSAAVAGCPGPEPHGGLGGAGGEGSSSSTSSSTTTTPTTTTPTTTTSTTTVSTTTMTTTTTIVTCGAPDFCAELPPTGWSGPFEAFGVMSPDAGTTAAPDASVAQVSCPTGTTVALHGGVTPIWSHATCSTCTCGTPTNVACAVVATLSSAAPCTNTSSCSPIPLGSACTEVLPDPSCAGVSVNDFSVSTGVTGGSCAPSTAVPTTTSPTWGDNVALCAPSSGPAVCATGVCAPKPGSESKLCVYQAGDLPCPSGPYTTTRMVIGTSFADTRGCGACTCAAPKGGCSGGQVSLSPSQGCNQVNPTDLPVLCAPAPTPPGQLWAQVTMVPTPTSTSCAASGGQPTGGVAAAGLTTICCM